MLNYQVYYKGQRQDKVVTYWLAQVKDPQHDPTLSEEHTEFRWASKADAIRLSGYVDFIEMLEFFHDQIKTL